MKYISTNLFFKTYNFQEEKSRKNITNICSCKEGIAKMYFGGVLLTRYNIGDYF